MMMLFFTSDKALSRSDIDRIREALDRPSFPPQLVVQSIDGTSGKTLAVCTDDGKVFGMQEACTVSSEAEGPTRVTVTFFIDGKDIRLA